MKRILALFLVLFLNIGLFSPAAVLAAEGRANEERADDVFAESLKDISGEDANGEALVRFDSKGNASALSRVGCHVIDDNITVASVSRFGDMCVALLKSDVYGTEELLRKAAGIPYITGVQSNSSMKLEFNGEQAQWYLYGKYLGKETVSGGINLDEMNITEADTPVVAVIDTGVDYNNPDLSGSMWVNPYSDLPGRFGFDFGDDDEDPMDEDGHGTHCAGIIAASRDDEGITGIADVKVMALKISDKNKRIYSANVLRAFEYVYLARTLGADIAAVNCSFGGGSDSGNVLEQVINMLGEEGVITFFAAGNEGMEVGADTNVLARQVPYCLASEYTVVAGAVTERDTAALFSNYGQDYVDVFAPGTNIVSDYNESLFVPFFKDDKTRREETIIYNNFSGPGDDVNILPPGTDRVYSAYDIGLVSDYTAEYEYSQNGGFMDNDGACLRILATHTPEMNFNDYLEKGNVNAMGVASSYIFLDVTDLDLDQNATYYFSCVMGSRFVDSGEIEWSNVTVESNSDVSRFFEVGGRIYFATVGVTGLAYGEQKEYYIDNMALSVPNLPTDRMEKLLVLSGTSMACPVAAGVYAEFRSANPEVDALTLKKAFLKNCVSKRSYLSGKCKTGAVVDASRLYNAVTEVTMSSSKKNVSYKKTKSFKLKAYVSPEYATNSYVVWSSSNKAYATVSDKGKVTVKKKGVGHTVKITAKASDGSGKKAVCKINIKA